MLLSCTRRAGSGFTCFIIETQMMTPKTAIPGPVIVLPLSTYNRQEPYSYFWPYMYIWFFKNTLHVTASSTMFLLLEPCISLTCAWKTNKFSNYSSNLLIMCGSSYRFRHYITILRERSYFLLRDAQLRSSHKALGTLPEDGNVMPKYVGSTTHN
jgi:hypothetical protein